MTTTSPNADTVISVRTTHATHERLRELAQATRRSRSSLVSEALEQYVAHQDWIAHEIERGVQAADNGNLVADSAISAWIESLEK